MAPGGWPWATGPARQECEGCQGCEECQGCEGCRPISPVDHQVMMTCNAAMVQWCNGAMVQWCNGALGMEGAAREAGRLNRVPDRDSRFRSATGCRVPERERDAS